MDKRAIIKISVMGIIITMTLMAIFLISNSSAITKSQYLLGEKVKIDLEEYKDYKLKITTPYTVIIKKGSGGVFIFKPEEAGSYKVEIKDESKTELFEFEVTKEKENTQTEKTEYSEYDDEEFQIQETQLTPEEINESEENPEEEFQITIGKPVRQIEKLNTEDEELRHKIPKKSENITVSQNGEKITHEVGNKLAILELFSGEKEIIVKNTSGEIEIEYYTQAPESKEKKISDRKKQITISSDLHYENVLTYTSINETLELENKDSIRIYWKEENIYLNFKTLDENENGIIDKIEWIVPHLSTQTFEIIIVTKAEHLDEDRNFIEKVYDKIKERDNIWQEIPVGHFIRATFEKGLTSQNDITIYAKSTSPDATVEVYEKDSNTKLADFGPITEDKKYQILLTSLNSIQETFDLLVVGGTVFFDLIIDPFFTSSVVFESFESTSPYYYEASGNWTRGSTAWDRDTGQSQCGSASAHIDAAGTETNYITLDSGLANLSGANQVNISFWWYCDTQSDNGEYFSYDEYYSGSWTNDVYSYHMGPCSNGWIYHERTLPAGALQEDFTVRFAAETNAGNEDIYIDCFTISREDFINEAPLVSSLILNSTFGTNMTTENLTCYSSATDSDNDPINLTYNWEKNGKDYATLNLPFNMESSNTSTKDYTGSHTVSSTANYISSGSHDSSGYYSFSGSTNLTINSDMSTVFGDTGTVMFWIRTSQVGSNTIWNAPGIFGVEQSGGGNDIFWGHINAAGNIGITAGNGATAYSVSAINDNTWHHIAMTRNSSSGRVEMYVDGSLSSFANSETGLKSTAFNWIGVIGDTGGTPVYFVGSLDDFLAFPFVMSPQQINSLYNKNYNLILSQETQVADIFSCHLTPNDGSLEGILYKSENLTILPYTTPITIALDVLFPLGNTNAYQNEFFNVTLNLTCLTGDCETINVTLDPIIESFENFETDEGGFTHSIAEAGKVDDWHRSSESSHDGSYSFKSGSTGTGDYSSYSYGNLTSPIYSMTANSTFSFYHYLNTEAGYDGAKMEYRVDSGSWTKVTNFISGGYNDQYQTYTGGPGDWTNGEDIWSGSIGSSGTFSFVRLNLSGISGDTIEFRFLFGSDSSQTAEGWYVDAINFTTEIPDNTKGVIPMNSGTPFYTTTQNPFTSNSLSAGESQTITFQINATGELDSVYTFFAYANQTSNPTKSNITSSWNVTIKEKLDPIGITINYPVGTFADVTPLLNLTINGTASTIWYNVNQLNNITVCNDCNEIPETFLHQAEGSHTLNVYANNSAGNTTYTSQAFTIDMNNNYFDTFLDNSSIKTFNQSFWDNDRINLTYDINSFQGGLNWDANDQTGDAAWANSGRSGYSFRNILQGSSINQSGNFMRLKFISGTDDPLRINNPTICERSGTTSDCVAGTWETLTINGSQNYLIPTNSERWTDWFEYDIDETKDYLVTFYMDTTSDGVMYLDAPSTMVYSSNGNDYSLNENWASLSPTSENLMYGVDLMEVRNIPEDKSYIISKEINTTNTIAEFTNITWNEFGNTGTISISVNVSADNGAHWYQATNGQGLVSITAGNSLIYKVFVNATDFANISLLDLNITWSNTASPAPDVTINYPTASTFPDVTPILNFSVTNGIANTVWYTINEGSNQVVCTNCNGDFTRVLYLQEGTYTVVVYTSNSLGEQKSDSVTFTINMNGNYFDTYLDDSQTWSLNGPWWLYGNMTYSDPTGGIVLNETFDSTAALDNWTMSTGTWTVTGGRLVKTNNVANSIVVYNPYDPLELDAGVNYNISMIYSNTDDDESGIIFRYIDNQNFYKCTFHDLDGSDPTTNNEGLTKWEGGVATVFDNGVYDLSDSMNTITVSIIEDNITCYLNGVAVYSVFDSSWDGGKVGVYNHYDDDAEYDDYLITTWGSTLPSFVSYPITTLQNIVEVLDVTWNNYLENAENNLTVDISTDNGATWHEAISGYGLGTLELDNDLVYRVNYKTKSTSISSLLDLNITWTHTASPAPTITVTDPGASFPDTTPILNATIDGPADTFWYTINGGSKNIICKTCAKGSYDVLLLLEEGHYDIDFYANNSIGTQSTKEVLFEVNMNRNYFDTFLDSSQIKNFNKAVWKYGNLTFLSNITQLFYDFETGTLGADWDNTNWGISTSQSIGTYSVACTATSNCDMLNRIDTSNANYMNLEFEYRDDDNDAGDIILYFNDSSGNWDNMGNIDAGSLGQSDDAWHSYSYYTTDSQYLHSGFAIRFFGDPETGENYWIDEINITTLKGKNSIIAHSINVSQSIRGISNITWNTAGTDINNPITVDLSVDAGNTWFPVTSGSAATGFTANSSLVYRINFSAIDLREMSFLDLNITWEEPPTINILYPGNNYVYNTPITKMNYTVSVSGSETLDSCWFTNNSGTTNYTITCGEDIITSSIDGVNIWTIYANDSSGSVGSDTVQFIIDTAAPIIVFLNQTPNPVDEGSLFEINVNVTDSNTDKVWIVIWESIVGGAIKFTGFLSNLFGDLFNTNIPIDSSYNLSHNFTIYANDTTGLQTNYTGNFTVLKAFFTLDNNPIYTDGISQAFASGYLGLTSSVALANHAFNIWLNGAIIPFENLTAHGTYLSELNFTGQNEIFAGSLLENVTDAGGYLTLTGTNTSGSMTGVLDAGAHVDWGTVDWDLLSSACGGTVNYYDGVAWGYDNTHDTYINSNNPTTNYGTDSSLRLDTSPDILNTLIKFDNIFGYGLNKIPYDSSITSSTMSVYVYDTGNAATAYEILEDWTQSQATYNGRLSGTSWGSTGLAGLPSRSLTSTGTITAATTGTKSMTITDLVASWNNQSKENYGLVFIPGGASETILRSSEYVTVSERPRLDITFSSTSCAGIEVYTRTSNDKLIWTDWTETRIGDKITDSLGYSRYLEYKVIFGSFNETIKPNLWDIEFNYTATTTDASGMFNYSFNTTNIFGTYNMNFTSGIRTIFTSQEAELRVQSGIDPVVLITYPSNNSFSSIEDVTIEYNATDQNGDLAYSILFVDGNNVSYNQSPMINGENTMDYTFTEGVHTYSIQVFDSSGLNDTTPTRTITIDLTDPIVNLIYPDNESTHTVGYLNLSFIAIDNLDSTLTCNVTLDGTNIEENSPFQNNTENNISTPGLSDGLHFWNVSCADDSKRAFTSETRVFNISDTPPTVTLISPADNSVERSQDVNFTFFPEDNSGITICELFIDGIYSGNVTNPELSKNATILATGISQGFHNWSVTCTDLSSTQANSGNWTIGIDTTGPTIEIFNPSDNFISSNATPPLDIRITDEIDNLLSCNLLVDGSIHDTFNATNGTRFNFTTANPMQDGIRSWRLNCTDDSGYSTLSPARNIDIREAPTIIIENINETHVSSTSLSVFYIPSDNTNVASCSLYVNGVLNITEGSITEDVQNLIEPTGFTNGEYRYYMTCTDDNGNIGTSEEYVVTLDTLAPISTLYFPLNEPVYATNVTFNFTTTDALSDQINCSLTIDSIERASNIIFTNATNQSVEISGISDGTHLWNLTCRDRAENLNTSETYNFTRFTSPGITLISPENESWLNYSDVEFIYFPQDDEGFTKAELYLNGAFDSEDTSVTSGINNSFLKTLSDGIYTWYIVVTDLSLMPSTSETRVVYIDTAAPIITLGLPAEDQTYDTNNVTFNFSVTDNLDPSTTCDLFVGADKEWTGSPTNTTQQIINLLLVDGNHTYKINCSDEAGNQKVSPTINFTIFAPPKITLLSPSNNTYTQNSSMNFSYIPIDALGLLNCSIYLDGTRNQSSSAIVQNIQNNFTITGISEGKHNWSVECVDTDENLNTSIPRIFYRDTTSPFINLTSPDDNAGLDANQDVTFGWTPTDLLDTLLICDLVVDSVIEDTSFATSGFPRVESVSGLSQGQHFWNVTCTDQSGNTNTSETRSFNYTSPDFLINETLITISNDNPTENETISINVTVHNIGGAPVSSVGIKFYNGDPEGSGVQIGTTKTISINAFSSNTTSIFWNAPLGMSNIFVIADFPDTITELDETNNKANKSLSVASWHFFYGSVNAETNFTLSDSSSYELTNWNMANLTKANIYVADYDSVIDWLSLQAIGKTTSGTSSNNDIQEIDTALSMTSFKDSHETLYLNSSSEINETRDYTVFTNQITQVPVATSINSSSFKTGILWDTSDDTNSEYDTTEKEDIVYITSVQKSTMGSYEISDYELRVPANLRSYDPSNQQTAVFYMEII
jgi:hypothetical protein